jgi:hypothetical protein
MFLARRFRIIIKPKIKLIIFDRKSLLHVLPVFHTGGITALLFKTPSPAKCLGHFEFKTLLPSSSVFCEAKFILYQDIQSAVHAEVVKSKSQELRLLLSAKFSSIRTTQVDWFLQVPSRSSFKRLVLGTTLWQHTKMSTIFKSPKGLKSEYEKGQLSSWPPIPYVPLTNLVTTNESPESLKIKLSNGTIFNMSIFSQGDTGEYLAQVIAVLHLMNQKRLDVQCRKLAKAVDKLAKTLENLQKPTGPKGATSKDDQESCKVEIAHTQEMLQESQKAHNEAVAKIYELLRNLLSGNPQSQWDCVCREMHKRDSWAGVNGQVTTGRHPRLWTAFQECLELHKLMVFSADAVKRQQFYI